MFYHLKLENISLKSNKKTLLYNLNVEVLHKERIAVIGPTGSGKTLFLNIISFGWKPNEGKIFINSEDFWKKNNFFQDKIRKYFYLVPQIPDMPNRQKVISALHASYINKWSIIKVIASLFFPFKKKSIELVLKELDLLQKIDENIETLSGGQKQAISIARIFLSQPNVMILDEPLSAVDPGRSNFLLKKILEYQKKTTATLICSLHQPEIAKKYFTRIIGINNGKIVFDGTPKKFSKIKQEEIYQGKPKF
ncbi:MAG: hypothetical protein CMP25_01770 [Rickettsiales bacterium]|nr:hypothetical protein [Rickettsiales bacterium]